LFIFRPITPPPTTTTGEGEDNLQGQIDFLNSVIVDMQKKNDSLKSKIDLLENAGILGKHRRESKKSRNSQILPFFNKKSLSVAFGGTA
jgi:hypothetical protein